MSRESGEGFQETVRCAVREPTSDTPRSPHAHARDTCNDMIIDILERTHITHKPDPVDRRHITPEVSHHRNRASTYHVPLTHISHKCISDTYATQRDGAFRLPGVS